MYNRNFKSLKKETDAIRRGKVLSLLWIGRIMVVEMAILANSIDTFNAIAIKILRQLFTDLE